MSEGGHLLYAYLQPPEEEAPGMEAGAALGSPLPPWEGAGLLRGLSLPASWERETTRRRCIPAWLRCHQSPVASGWRAPVVAFCASPQR